MPIMDGIQATKKIRNLDAEKKSVKIIAITAFDDICDKNMCFNVGMDGYL